MREPTLPTPMGVKKPLDYKVVIYEANHELSVAKITLNRPRKMNALSHQLRGEIFPPSKLLNTTRHQRSFIKGAAPCFSAAMICGGMVPMMRPLRFAYKGFLIGRYLIPVTGKSGNFRRLSSPNARVSLAGVRNSDDVRIDGNHSEL